MLDRCFQIAMMAMKVANMSSGLFQLPSANFPCFQAPKMTVNGSDAAATMLATEM